MSTEISDGRTSARRSRGRQRKAPTSSECTLRFDVRVNCSARVGRFVGRLLARTGPEYSFDLTPRAVGTSGREIAASRVEVMVSIEEPGASDVRAAHPAPRMWERPPLEPVPELPAVVLVADREGDMTADPLMQFEQEHPLASAAHVASVAVPPAAAPTPVFFSSTPPPALTPGFEIASVELRREGSDLHRGGGEPHGSHTSWIGTWHRARGRAADRLQAVSCATRPRLDRVWARAAESVWRSWRLLKTTAAREVARPAARLLNALPAVGVRVADGAHDARRLLQGAASSVASRHLVGLPNGLRIAGVPGAGIAAALLIVVIACCSFLIFGATPSGPRPRQAAGPSAVAAVRQVPAATDRGGSLREGADSTARITASTAAAATPRIPASGAPSIDARAAANPPATPGGPSLDPALAAPAATGATFRGAGTAPSTSRGAGGAVKPGEVGTVGRGAGNGSNRQVSFASRNNDETDDASNAIRFVGSLGIDSTPRGARVILDGVSRGSAPLTLSELRAGTHTVRLELDGYQRWTTAVTVVSGRHVRLTPVLQPRRDRDAANNPE